MCHTLGVEGCGRYGGEHTLEVGPEARLLSLDCTGHLLGLMMLLLLLLRLLVHRQAAVQTHSVMTSRDHWA